MSVDTATNFLLPTGTGCLLQSLHFQEELLPPNYLLECLHIWSPPEPRSPQVEKYLMVGGTFPHYMK
jgi:hypothetical protein